MLQQFIADSRVRGLAKGNRFTVYFQPPYVLQRDVSPGIVRAIMLYCNRAEIPGVSFSTAPIRTTGEVRNVPYDRNFDAFTLSFYADGTMNAKYFFDAWLEAVQSTESRVFSYYDDYTIPKMVIDMEDHLNRPIYRVECFDVYPKQVHAVPLDMAHNGVVEIQVTFEYRYSQTVQMVGGLPIVTSRPGIIDQLFANTSISLQGLLGLNKAGGRFQGGVGLSTFAVAPGATILASTVGSVGNGFKSLAGSIIGLSNQIPGGMYDATNAATIASMSAQANNYAVATNNMGIQMATPAGLNLNNMSLAQISAGLNKVNNGLSSNSSIYAAINSFIPSSVGSITTQLGTIGGHLNNLGVDLSASTASLAAGIAYAVNSATGNTAPNVPR